MSKVLIVSHCVPPVPFAPSFVFRRLLKYFPNNSYVVLTSRYENKDASFQGHRLPCKYYYAGGSIFRNYSRWSYLREWLDIVPMVIKGIATIRKEKVTGLLVYPIAGNFLLASYLLHIFTGVPLYIYMLDLYASSQVYKLRRWMSVPLEKLVMKVSKKVFVMSEALKDFYGNKYDIDPVLLPHPIELKSYDTRIMKNMQKTRDGRKVIAFTGMIYEAQMDALQNLVNAVKGMSEVEFHIYSYRTTSKLISLGLSGNNIIHHGYVEPLKIADIQRDADILFLPMAFNSPYPDIIKTASPGKLPEYLASGTPILIHAPEYAYITWYAKRYGWGLVVDKPDLELLRKAIRVLLRDDVLREKLVENALNTVEMHEESKVSNTLQKCLGIT